MRPLPPPRRALRALLLAVLLTSPTVAALLPADPPAPLPGTGPLAAEHPGPFPLSLEVPEDPAEQTVGVPTEVEVTVVSEGLAGSHLQLPVDRDVHVAAALDSGEPVAVEPATVVIPAGAERALAVVRFTPTRLGPLTLTLDADWDLLPGDATLDVARTVVKDTLAVEGLAAGAPDSDYRLPLAATLVSGHLASEPLAWRVEAEHAPVNATQPVVWTAAEGSHLADPTGEPWTAEVVAKHGPGRYTFRLLAGGARLEDAAAEVEASVPEVREQSEGVDFVLEVEDAPTTLALTSDSVNDDGKTKSPGSDLITRVKVADANGLGDVAAVAFRYLRAAAPEAVLVEEHRVTGLGAAATEAHLEDRFTTSPMKDADYEARIVALDAADQVLAEVRRTFVITDVKPQAEIALDEASRFPDRAGDLEGTLTVRDANFGTGPLDAGDITELEEMEVRLYRGSRQVDEPGWTVRVAASEAASPLHLDLSGEGTRSTTHTYREEEDKGALLLNVAVVIPEGASAGSYRLSVVHQGTTLGSATFEVRDLPRVTALSHTGEAMPGGAFAISVAVRPSEGVEALELRTPWDTTVRVPRADLAEENGTLSWQGRLEVPLPWDDEAAAVLTVVADLGEGRVVRDPAGGAVNAREAELVVGNAPPRVEATLSLAGAEVRGEAWVHPLAAEELRARGRAADDNALSADLSDEVVSVEAEVRDWQGQSAAFEVAGALTAGDIDVQVRPAGAEPGRYLLRLLARDDDHAAGLQELPINVGTHFRMALLAPPGGIRFQAAPEDAGAGAGLAAEVQVRLEGNAPAGVLSVLVEGLPAGLEASVRLTLPDGSAREAALAAGYARFDGTRLLSPGETAVVEVLVPEVSGVPAGRFAGRILVAGEAA